jgi:hypothetical protein
MCRGSHWAAGERPHLTGAGAWGHGAAPAGREHATYVTCEWRAIVDANTRSRDLHAPNSGNCKLQTYVVLPRARPAEAMAKRTIGRLSLNCFRSRVCDARRGADWFRLFGCPPALGATPPTLGRKGSSQGYPAGQWAWCPADVGQALLTTHMFFCRIDQGCQAVPRGCSATRPASRNTQSHRMPSLTTYLANKLIPYLTTQHRLPANNPCHEHDSRKRRCSLPALNHFKDKMYPNLVPASLV